MIINKNTKIHFMFLLLCISTVSFSSQKQDLGICFKKLLYARAPVGFYQEKKRAESFINYAELSELFVVKIRPLVGELYVCIEKMNGTKQFRQLPGKKSALISGFRVMPGERSLDIKQHFFKEKSYDLKDKALIGNQFLCTITTPAATALLFQLDTLFSNSYPVGSEEFNNLLAIAERASKNFSNKEVQMIGGFSVYFAHDLILKEKAKELSKYMIQADHIFKEFEGKSLIPIFNKIAQSSISLDQALNDCRLDNGFFVNQRVIQASLRFKFLFDELASISSDYKIFSQDCAKQAQELATKSKSDIWASFVEMRKKDDDVSNEDKDMFRSLIKLEARAQQFLSTSQELLWDFVPEMKRGDEIDLGYKVNTSEVKKHLKRRTAAACLPESEGNYLEIDSSTDDSESDTESIDVLVVPTLQGKQKGKREFCLAADGWETKVRSSRIRYHSRISDWFCNQEKREAATKSECIYHTFPTCFDSVLVQEGIRFERINRTTGRKDTVYQLPGEIIHQDCRRESVVFSITKTDEGLCYHRGIISFANADDLLKECGGKSKVVIDQVMKESDGSEVLEVSDCPKLQEQAVASRMRKTGRIESQDELHIKGTDILNRIRIILYRTAPHMKK